MSEYSIEGKDNQLIFSERANRFYGWIYEEIKPFIKGDVLEIGSGLGSFSKILINGNRNNRTILSDIDEKFVKLLSCKYRNLENVSVKNLNLENINYPSDVNFSVDTCILINVLEHIKDDIKVIQSIYNILNTNGNLILLIPAHKYLYNIIDKSVGHFRRYNKKDIKRVLESSKFKLIKLNYFNFIAIFGWILNGSILKRSVINEKLLSLYDKLIPFMRFFEKYILFKKMGMSMIIVLKKDY